MTDKTSARNITAEEYLAIEESAPVRHEYVDGQIFAMTGSTNAHNLIAGNLFAALHAHLRGSGCHAYMNDMKVSVRLANSFYYPDVMVTCESAPGSSVFLESPTMIAEVLSPSTKQIDRREKLVAYRKLSSLQQYLLIHQKSMVIELYTKFENEWQMTRLTRFDDLILASAPGQPLVIPLQAIYEGLDIPSFVEEDENEYELGEDDDY